jgi:hypothetical protein
LIKGELISEDIFSFVSEKGVNHSFSNFQPYLEMRTFFL